MTSTAAFPSLSVPAPDENMEMSSPALRNLDDDIEIDFDDYPGGVQVTDDERMLEDADPTRPATATDDMMEDETLPAAQPIVEEEIMQDDGLPIQQVHQEDEELIDYGEDEIHEPDVDDTVLPSVVEESGPVTQAGTEHVDEGTTAAPDLAIPEVPASDVIQELTSETVHDLPADTEDFLAAALQTEDRVNVEADQALAAELRLFQSDEDAIFAPADQPAPAPTHDAAPAPPSINTAVSTHADTPGTPTDTGLHPMTIRYGDMRMPLFKSRRQPDGLLKDDNLASLSLAELIKNCRQRLALKIGEDISDDQELVLGFEHLGLMLVEDSRASFENSLNDITEVYLQLHHNDAVQEIPALSLTLSLQLKFASSFSIFKQAAAGGQGMSSFGFLQPAGEEEYYHEEYEDGDDTGQYGDEYDEQAKGENTDATGQHNVVEDFHQTEQTGEDAGEYEQDEYYHEQEEYHDETYPDETNQDQAPPGLEDLLQGEHRLTDSINDTLDDTAAAGQDTATKSAATHLKAALGTANDTESRASSTTVQGDNAAGNAGEYDYIDWDDDTLTSDLSAPVSDEHDDFSTFLTEFEAEDQEAALEKDGQDDVEGQHVSGLPEEQHIDQTFDAQHLGSEDFLNDLGENAYDGQEHYEEQEYEEEGYEPGEENEDHGEEDYNQADTFGEQQEEYHPDYEPAEGEEQFHTAQDFFNGEYYEHGLEHDADGADGGLDDTLGTVVHHPVEEYDEGDTQEDFEDDLRFDDDNDELEQQPPQDAAKTLKHARSGSPLGKRSFDEHADEDDLETDEREVKKSRAS